MARPVLPVPAISAVKIKRRRTVIRRSLKLMEAQGTGGTLLADELRAELLDLGAQMKRHRNARTVALRKARRS